jgi:hypothetical protein
MFYTHLKSTIIHLNASLHIVEIETQLLLFTLIKSILQQKKKISHVLQK